MTSRARSYLSSLAAKMADTLILGRDGADPGFTAQLDRHLEAHELVKVRFNDYKGEKIEISTTLAEKTKSEIVRIIGNTAIFFRRNPDPEKRKLEFPATSSSTPSSPRTKDTKRRET